MSIALLCELGREEVQFATIDLFGSNGPANVEKLHVTDFVTFTDAIIYYLKKVEIQGKVAQFALAVAGVVRGNSVGATNGRWLLSISGLSTFLGVKPMILNDFSASAYALKSLPVNAFRPVGALGGLRPAAEASFALIGPLDGLGVAGLLCQGLNNFVIQSEAGHAAISPTSSDAQKFLIKLQNKYRTAYAEHLLSEDGLRRAYSFFANDGSVEIAPTTVTHIISQTRNDNAAKAAVALFTSQLAAFSRDIVLTLGTWGGVYYSGPTANALYEYLSSPQFRTQFNEGHRYSRLLREVPMAVVTENQTVLVGLAAAVRESAGQRQND
jgi:glucokinase